MQITNQRPCRLEPHYTDDITKDYDKDAVVKLIGDIIDPIYTPLTQGHPVTIQDDKGKDIPKEDIINEILSCSGETVNIDAEDFVKELFRKTLAFYGGGLSALQVFIAQANAKVNAPIPASNVIYTVDDLKAACKDYLATKNEDGLIVNTAFFINEPCVIFHFLTKFTFQEYKDYVKTMVQNMSSQLSPDVIGQFTEFDKIDLDIAEGLLLRNKDGEGCEPFSFQRILMNLTMMFVNGNDDAGIVAPYLDELLSPANVLFLDVERISKTGKNKLNKTFDDIKSAIKTPIRVLSNKKINKLTTIARSKRRMQANLNAHKNLLKEKNLKAKVFRFGKVAPTKLQLNKYILKIISKEVNVAASENYAKVIKSSYQRANRRQPDNYNLPGKSISMVYKPDIHFYLDTSGSISEDNYKSAIITLIKACQKLGVNIYFNSFSHIMSQCTKLHVRGKSVSGIYKEFQKVPKVTGGTDYAQIWDYINMSPKRKREISFIITDFEYTPPSKHVDHPQKLYYVPIDVSKQSWNMIKNYAERFCKAMYHIDNRIRAKLLM